MSRKNSDNFGDVASDPPSPTPVPSENAQLRRRHLNKTGLPNGIRENERELEHEAVNSHHSDVSEDEDDHEEDQEEEEEEEEPVPTPEQMQAKLKAKTVDKEEGRSLKAKAASKEESKSLGQRLRSPLGSTLNLDELRSQISQGVEVKYVPLTSL
jgi:hypothetical protein